MSMNTRVRQTLLLAFSAMVLTPAIPMGAMAEGGDAPTVLYANLPDKDPATTGSLPGPGRPLAPTATGFQAFVDQGSILLRANAPTGCLPGDLREVVADVAARFGSVSIESTHRSRSRNWRAGGARQSLHISCRAIDFRVQTRARRGGVFALASGSRRP